MIFKKIYILQTNRHKYTNIQIKTISIVHIIHKMATFMMQTCVQTFQFNVTVYRFIMWTCSFMIQFVLKIVYVWVFQCFICTDVSLFCFTIQLHVVMLHVFIVKVKNFAFDTTTIITFWLVSPKMNRFFCTEVNGRM